MRRPLPMPDLIRAFAALGFEAQPLLGAAAGAAQPDEPRRWSRALAVAGFASMNVMLLSVSVWSGADGATRDLFHWLSALIAIPTVAYSGRPFFRSAWSALRRGRPTWTCRSRSACCWSTAISLYETIVDRRTHVYFDGAVMLLFFLLAGRVLDSVMRDRAATASTALLRQHARPGRCVLGGGRHQPMGDGATIWRWATGMLIAAGERLAADGVDRGGAQPVRPVAAHRRKRAGDAGRGRPGVVPARSTSMRR